MLNWLDQIHGCSASARTSLSASSSASAGQLRDGALLHLHVQAAGEAGGRGRARRGGGVRVAAGEQQELHVLRAAVAEGGPAQGEPVSA